MKTLSRRILGVLLLLRSLPGTAQIPPVPPPPERPESEKPAAAVPAEEAILRLSGATSLEELDENEYERLEALRTAPLPINTASRTRLESSGLLTRFQVLSLLDYRLRSGPVRSLSELGLVDGFSPESARALGPFISLHAPPPGKDPQRTKARHEGLLRVAWRNGDLGYAAKYRFTGKEGYCLSAACRSTVRAQPGAPDSWSFTGCLPLRRYAGKVLLGDYNARFGQGLVLWNGFSLSGIGNPDALARRPGGLSPAWSFSPDGPLRGVAADLGRGRFQASLAAAFPGLRRRMDGDARATVSGFGAGNLGWTGRNAEASATILVAPPATGLSSKCAADFRWTPGALGAFGEAALDLRNRCLAAVGGLVWKPAYRHTLALALRHYPATFGGDLTGGIRAGTRCSGESGLSAGVRLPWLQCGVDRAWFPVKGYAQTKILCLLPLPWRETLSLTPRCALRWRQGTLRAEYRLEAAYTGTPWQAKLRGDVVRCQGTAWLAYAEGGCKTARFSLYARTGIFKVDDWDDRIYVYERDVPGCFNVPAYYGRGYSASLNGGFRWRHHRLNWHAACIRYVGDKPRRSEYKLQYSFDF